MLAYNEEREAIWTYRVDRMKEVRLTGQPREGEKAFQELDIRTFVQRTISMYSGTKERVTIYFIMSLLDTVIEQFGKTNASYDEDEEYDVGDSEDGDSADE